MGYIHNTELQEEYAQTPNPARAVPQDWFLDPADPSTAPEGLEEAATAFLAAHDAGLLTEDSTRLLTDSPLESKPTLPTVVPLQPRSEEASTEDAEEAQRKSLWEAIAPFADEESGALAWQGEALCAQTDPEAFFPEKGGSTRDAKRVCSGCSVRQQCLEYALANDERFGIWGGLSERERRRIRRSQR